MKKKRSNQNFRVKRSTAAKAVTIEGFANRATKDRIGDMIPGKAWELENFKKNPIIFFNHDRNIPIGKAIDVKATDEGLKIKVRISKSNEAPIPFIRDMIKEGIVKTFSVGFDDHETFKKDEESGLNVPEVAELLETSVVTLPMHQDSDFSLSKGLKAMTSTWTNKSYHEAKKDVFMCKGAWVSVLVEDALEKLADDIDFDREDVFEKLALETHLTLSEVMDIINGNAKEVPDAVLTSLAEILNIGIDELKDMRERQQEGEADDKEEDEEEDEEEKTEKEGDEEDEEEEDEEEKGMKSPFEKNSYQDAIAQMITKLVKEGMGRDQAVAVAISECKEKGKKSDLSREDYRHLFAIADCKKEDASDEVGLDASKENDVNFPNPQIDLQKAQLAMSGSAVQLLREIKEELRTMNTKMDGTPKSEGEDVATTQEDTENEESKQLDRKQKILDAFTKRLDRLNQSLGETDG